MFRAFVMVLTFVFVLPAAAEPDGSKANLSLTPGTQLASSSSSSSYASKKIVSLIASKPANAFDGRIFGTLQIPAPKTAFAEVQLRPLHALAKTARAAAPRLASVTAGSNQRVLAAKQETRVFWYSMGASALTSLGLRVFLFFPALIATPLILAAGSAMGPAALIALWVGLGATVAVIDALISAVASAYVFDSMSRYYESNIVGGFAGQLMGSALAASTIGVMFGFGTMLIYGADSLSLFTGAGVASAFSLISILGVMPAVVIGFFASVVIPAVAGAWGLSMTARPKAGFKIDPEWRLRETQTERALPRTVRQRQARLLPLAFPIPGT